MPSFYTLPTVTLDLLNQKKNNVWQEMVAPSEIGSATFLVDRFLFTVTL